MIWDIIKAILNLKTPDMTSLELEVALNKLSQGNAERLDWRNSIVDLLKLLKLDSSLAARAILAKELGHEGEFTGTAEQNIWLHKQVLRKVSEHNIKIPAGLI